MNLKLDFVGISCPRCESVVSPDQIIERNGRIGCVRCWRVSWLETF